MNDHIKQFLKDIRNVTDADILIKTGDTVVKAHSYILKARSPVFRAMLDNTWTKETKERIIDLSNYSEVSVRALMLYLKDIVIPPQMGIMHTVEVYELADQYAIDELKREFYDRVLSFAYQFSTAMELLRCCHIDKFRKSALATVAGSLRNGPVDKSVDLAGISDEVKIEILDYLLITFGYAK